MNLILPGILAAFSAMAMMYFFLSVLIGQYALEQKKLRSRVEYLVNYRRKEFLRQRVKISVALDRMFSQTKFIMLIDELLRYSNLNVSAGQFILLDLFCSAISSGVVFCIYFNFDFACVTFLVTAMLPVLYLKLTKGKYIQNFIVHFPDTLVMMKNAARAGQGIQSNFKTISLEAPPPVSIEFDRMVREIELGSHVQEALNNLYTRIKTRDVKLFVLGLAIQMEVGGNLSDLLDNLAKNIRDRISLKREISALTSQAKASAIILIAMPWVIALMIYMTNPHYFAPLFQEGIGKWILLGSFASWLIGSLIIMRMLKSVDIVN